MRFSVLTLNLGSMPSSVQTESSDRLARFVADRNLTSICLQACEQSPDATLVDMGEAAGPADADLRSDNPAYRLRAQLEEYGLKYGIVWKPAGKAMAGVESGPAILSQLPILGSSSRRLFREETHGSQSGLAVMARLAVSPTAVIDLYDVELGSPAEGLAEQISALTGFVEDTPRVLQEMKPPAPRRRGPPRKKKPGDEPPEATRLLCVAGSINDEPEGDVQALSRAGYLEASAGARARLAEQGGARGGAWTDYVFIRPALRPQSSTRVFHGEDLEPFGEHSGVIVEFEV